MSMASEERPDNAKALRLTQAENEKLWRLFQPVAEDLAETLPATFFIRTEQARSRLGGVFLVYMPSRTCDAAVPQPNQFFKSLCCGFTHTTWKKKPQPFIDVGH